MRQMPYYLSRTAWLVAVMASPAWSADVSQCDRFTFGHHAGDVEHVDLGHGHIVFARFQSSISFEPGTGSSSSWLHIVQCQTGKTLVVAEKYESTDEQFDFASDVERELDRAVTSDVAYTIEELETMFDNITGSRAELSTSSEESCACRVAYPRLRGDKTPFDLSELPQ